MKASWIMTGIIVLAVILPSVTLGESVSSLSAEAQETERRISDVEKSRTLIPTPPKATKTNRAYCTSSGGSTSYESISSASISINPGGTTATLTVQIYIANPTGCIAGNPCPEYDNSPEYVNAWIDWNQDDDWYDGNERVMDAAGTGYLNINYQGTMTLVTQFTIPAGITGERAMRVNLGWGYDPNDPCDPSWAWGDVLDLFVNFGNLAVTRLSAQNDVPIDNVADPIWRKIINPDGSLADDTPPGDRVIADSKASGSFDIQATVTALAPAPTWNPTVDCMWSLDGQAGISSFTGWSGTFTVTVPQSVGVYNLTIFFTIRDPNGNVVRQQTVMMPVYITYDMPLAGVSPPKLKWLESACTWASGAVTEGNVLDFLTTGIYTQSGGIYEDFWVSWSNYVENSPGVQANCVVFSDVWDGLCQVLGVAGTSVQRTRGSNNIGFVTKGGTSMDGKTGNAYALAAGGPPCDKWCFGMHQVGRKTNYWDPTMGVINFTPINDFIKWNITGWGAGGIINADGGHTIQSAGGMVGATWSTVTYDPAVEIAAGGSYPTGSAILPGEFSDAAYDDNGDGWYDRLTVTATVLVYNPGKFRLQAIVTAGDSVVSVTPSWAASMPSHVDSQLSFGGHYLELSFSGEEIYRSGYDGPYIIEWVLLDSVNGFMDNAFQVTTTAYEYMDFGELPARIQSQWDEGVDLEPNGLYNLLRSHVTVDLSREGNFSVGGILLSDSMKEIASAASASSMIGPGMVEFILDFDGPDINESNKFGPYDLSVWILETGEGQVSEGEFSTGSYSPDSFEVGPIGLIGDPDTSLVDIDSDYLIDSLVIEIDFTSDSTGILEWIGWLVDGEGSSVATATAQYDPMAARDAGSADEMAGTVHLSFVGTEINASNLDGPYTLSYLVATGTPGMAGFEDVFTTEYLPYTLFEALPPPLISYVGSFSDSPVDTSGNELFDYLAFGFYVSAADSGNIIGNGLLADMYGEEIQWSSGYVHCPMEDSCYLEIDFDGLAISEHGESGPYYLKNLIVYHTGDPGQMYSETMEIASASYAYTEFTTCGDANTDGALNVGDAVFLINYVFKGGAASNPLCISDANGDGSINVGDAVYMINYVFKGGSKPSGCFDLCSED
ncbi:MAG: hypothetical protein GY841_18870 [FCB group bacterium]|nr:hypothetical protein [FCB group bacterium]